MLRKDNNIYLIGTAGIANPKRDVGMGNGDDTYTLLMRSTAISQGMIQMFSNFLTFSSMMLGPR